MKRIAMLIVALGTSITLAACGSNDSTTGASTSTDSTSASASASEHNPADVSFAQGMIPHHRQALMMAGMAADRASMPEVKDLASRIKAAQDPEIQTMSGWHKSWGEDVPADGSMGMGGGQGSSSMPMAGMMTNDEMSELMGMGGSGFDRMFLTSMTEHHKGAIEMAKTEQAQGSYLPAKELAAKISQDQQAEITEMADLLAKIN